VNPTKTFRALAVGAVAVLAFTAAGAAPADATPPTKQVRTVVLPTGEKLGLTWTNGRPRVTSVSNRTAPLTITNAGPDVYAIPAYAIPYLTSKLDRELFDVTKLATIPAGKVPVSLTYSGQPVPVPGVTITSATKGTIDPSTFGAGLRNHKLAAGLTRLALDAPRSQVVRPQYEQVTLTVTFAPPPGVTIQGALAMITNTDDYRRYTNFVGIGPENYIKVSLPKGHYTIVVNAVSVSADGQDFRYYLPIQTDIAVTSEGQSVAVEAGKATASPSFTTPRPATGADYGVDLVPTRASDGIAYGMGISYDAKTQIFVQPTSAPKHGILEFDAYETLDSTEPDGSPSTYHVTADWSSGIPANLHRTIRAAELARVVDRFFDTGTSTSRYFARGVAYPDLRGALVSYQIAKAPTHVDYVYGPSNARWVSNIGEDSDQTATAGVNIGSGALEYRAGKSYSVDWMRGQLGSGFFGGQTLPRASCGACRTADTMALSVTSALDSNPDHYGYTASNSTGYERLQVFQDGTQIVDAADSDNVTVKVPAEPHAYRIESTLDRAKLGFSSSDKVTAVYTVPSSATSGAAVPTGWQCPASSVDACTVLPLLTAQVPLPVSQKGTLPVGVSSFVVTAGHILAAKTSAITGVTFATSVDGKTYTPAAVHKLGNGRYLVTLQTPSTTVGQHMSVRVTSADAAGSSLSMTTTNAYTVTGS
jgi:hypothetical protein